MRLVFALLLVGCARAHEAPPELLACPESPYVGERYLWRGESPPRGRIWACEACMLAEEEAIARMVALDCPLRATHAVCTPSGACDYATLHATLGAIARVPSCEALDAIVALDPCVRPDADTYWRPEGD